VSLLKITKFNNHNGFTLIEILIAMAILLIIVVAFLSVFTNSFIAIASMGDKSRASADAQKIIDRVYGEGDLSGASELRASISSIVQEIEPNNFEDYTDKIGLFDEENSNGKKIRFYITSTEDLIIKNNVFILTLRVYYQNNKKHVTISSPLIR
jgi:prepilin-type N-terminal cleavage/methylation domain-containing protein